MITWHEMQREYLTRLIIDFNGSIGLMTNASGISKPLLLKLIRRHGLSHDMLLARMSNPHKETPKKGLQ